MIYIKIKVLFLIQVSLRQIIGQVFASHFSAVAPPKVAERSNKQIRHGEHVQNARVQAAARFAAGFQVAFGGDFAHRALRRGFVQRRHAEEKQEGDF